MHREVYLIPASHWSTMHEELSLVKERHIEIVAYSLLFHLSLYMYYSDIYNKMRDF